MPNHDYSFYCSSSFYGALNMCVSSTFIQATNQYLMIYSLNKIPSIVQYFSSEAKVCILNQKDCLNKYLYFKEALLQTLFFHVDLMVRIKQFSFFFQNFIFHKYYTYLYIYSTNRYLIMEKYTGFL
ncbi:unnamed protein product [Paramecium sonneborni]|uniref:Uncharacterized protein n=1 Tax=Paramecium sonneborni TaxID=65129 RepID=A0A8S1N4T2_9CILI|nr:unnamed protein product [Paramecium sonneborni]